MTVTQARGRFITVEGVDGAGKSSQIKVIESALRERGIDLILTREPGGTEISEKIRNLILNEPMGVKCEMLLMFAARQEHLEKVIEPALAAGKWVLCDRFTDASYAYQSGGRQQPKEWIDYLVNFVHPGFKPDRTVLFDLDTDIAMQRLNRTLDRIESEGRDFHVRVRQGYLQLAKADPQRFLVVDSSRPKEEISELLRQEFATWS